MNNVELFTTTKFVPFAMSKEIQECQQGISNSLAGHSQVLPPDQRLSQQPIKDHEQHGHIPRNPWPVSNYDTRIKTPIVIKSFNSYLSGYNETKRKYLFEGFTFGFRIPFSGVRQFIDCRNLLSARKEPEILKAKIIKEIEAGRVVCPFTALPFKTLQVSPLGLVPKNNLGNIG